MFFSTQLFCLLLPALVISEGIPRHLHLKLKKAHTFHDILDSVHLIYHPEKTNSHILKTFPTSAPREPMRIMSGSFMKPKMAKSRMMGAAASDSLQSSMEHIDPHTADHLSLFGSIRQGNDTCQLQSVCVPIPLENEDPQVVIFPKCYEVMQCVGSCCESFEKCHPHSISFVQKPIVELVYVGNDRFMLNKTMNITMEEHTSCSCYDCGPNAPTCSAGFSLGPSCKCECANKAERNNCLGSRVWDAKKCTCSCDRTCASGLRLDRSSCECVRKDGGATKHDGEIVVPTKKSSRYTSQEYDISALPKLKATVVQRRNNN